MQSATCPKCRQEMNVMATECPHCHYDFPKQTDEMKPNRGLAYSPLADIALMLGILSTLIGAFVFLGAAALWLLRGDFLRAGLCVLGFFSLLAQYVVFQRVGDRD